MKENGFEYVDLGLPSKTMWATCNVGATKPEDEGLLFQFGRVDGYKYGDKNNKFIENDQNKQDTGSHYRPLTTSGKIYKKHDILDLEDDAAHVHMGGAWKMPTKDQLEELYYNMSNEVVTINGLQGMLFTSNINNKQLFAPFVGYWYDGNYYCARSCAVMWSSQVLDSYVNGAYRLYCDSDGESDVNNYNLRSIANSVRGVFNK